MKSMRYSLPLALALAATFAAAPADAQGNGRGNGRGNSVERRDEDRDRDRDRRVRDRDDDRREEPRFERRTNRRVPPGWCIGRGNPHNTPENCGYNSGTYRDRNGNIIYGRDGGVYSRDGVNGGGNGGSYDRAHQEFHYQHDRRCRELARQRPLDPIYQVRISRQCAEEHQAFHRQWGIPHR